MIKTTIKQQLNNIIELQNTQNKKITLNQEKEQKQNELLNDINFFVDNIIVELRNKHNDNLYFLYHDYLNNKADFLEDILGNIKGLKVKELQEIPTSQGFKYENILVNKHIINNNNIYRVAELIENIFDKKINDFINKKQKEQKQLEKLKNDYISIENKSPPIKSNNLNFFSTGLAISIGIFKGVATHKHKKRR